MAGQLKPLAQLPPSPTPTFMRPGQEGDPLESLAFFLKPETFTLHLRWLGLVQGLVAGQLKLLAWPPPTPTPTFMRPGREGDPLRVPWRPVSMGEIG